MAGKIKIGWRALLAGIAWAGVAGCHRVVEPEEAVYYTPLQKQRALAVSAVLTAFNEDDWFSLTGVPEGSERGLRQTKRILRGWGVASREDLLETAEAVRQGGQHRRFDRLCRIEAIRSARLKELLFRFSFQPEWRREIVREQGGRLKGKSLLGFDLMRVVSLFRWSVYVGYITEEEAWPHIMEAARQLQQTFDSWEDLGGNYLIGRRFWSARKHAQNGYCFERAVLLLTRNPQSPWAILDWDMDVTGSPQPLNENARVPETSLYFVAEDLLAQDRDREAVAVFEAVLERDDFAIYKGFCCDQLGQFYRWGYGDIQIDIERAREWFERGVEFHNGECMRQLAMMYEKGIGVVKDYDKALQYAEAAVAAGEAEAFTAVGLFAHHGRGMEKNPAKALAVLEEGASLGSFSCDTNAAWVRLVNPDLWDEEKAVATAYRGRFRWNHPYSDEILVRVLMKAKRYPEAWLACSAWIRRWQKGASNYDVVALPQKIKKRYREIRDHLNAGQESVDQEF